MKLLRWAVAGASVYAIYKYSIGRKARGEDVITSPERVVADLTKEAPEVPEAAAPPPKRKKAQTRKSKGSSAR